MTFDRGGGVDEGGGAAHLLRRARFEFRTREEATTIARVVTALLPGATVVEFALLELMINAIEHGNLGIGADRKAALVRRGELEREIERRQRASPFCARIAWLELARDPAGTSLSIGDEGDGFDWRSIRVPLGGTPCGRGLELVRRMAPSPLEFNERGNVVTLRLP